MPIDPITGYVTSNGTERQLIIAAQQNQRIQDARHPLATGDNPSHRIRWEFSRGSYREPFCSWRHDGRALRHAVSR